jgi:hypothetical protein
MTSSRQHARTMNDVNVNAMQFVEANGEAWALFPNRDARELIRQFHQALPLKSIKSKKSMRPPGGFKWVKKKLSLYYDEVEHVCLVIARVKNGSFRRVMKLVRPLEDMLPPMFDLVSGKNVEQSLAYFDINTKKAKDNRDVVVRVLALPRDLSAMAVYIPDDMLNDKNRKTDAEMTKNQAAFMKDAKRGIGIYHQLLDWYNRNYNRHNVQIDAMAEAYLKNGDGSIENVHGDGWNHVLRCIVVSGSYSSVPRNATRKNIMLGSQCDKLLPLEELHKRIVYMNQEYSVRIVQSGFVSNTRMTSSKNTNYKRTIYNQRREPAEEYSIRMGTGAVGGALAKTLDDLLIPYNDFDLEPLINSKLYSSYLRSHVWRDAEEQMLDLAQLIIEMRSSIKPSNESLLRVCQVGLYSRYILHGITVDRSFPYATTVERHLKKRNLTLDDVVECTSTPSKNPTEYQPIMSMKRFCQAPNIANIANIVNIANINNTTRTL